MKRFKVIVLAFIILIGFLGYAEAGVVFTTIDTSFDDPRNSGTGTAYIGDNGMRAETRAEGEKSTIIFRSDKEVFWVINTADNSYTEMTKDDIRKIKGRMDDAMRMMREQMKNMPPEQREMMEQMMKGKEMPAQPEKKVFKKVASGVKAGKWRCDRYEGYRGGQLIEEVCTTSWKDLGIDQKDFHVMERMGEFMNELSPDAASNFNFGSEDWEANHGYPGVPVRTISYSMGKKVSQTEIQEIKKQKIDSSLFELPKGLTKQSFMDTEN